MHIGHARLDDGDTSERQGVPVTSPLRSAFDLARHLPTMEAVAAADMMLHRRLFDLATLERYVQARPVGRGSFKLGGLSS
jgi:hypothetical protein